MPTPIDRDRVTQLMCRAGHAINANDGRCPLIEGVLCEVTSLCCDLLAALPEPGLCEHRVPDGDYCPDCRAEYHRAAAAYEEESRP